MAHGCGHPTHLAISSFGQCDLQPRCRHALAKTDGRIARGKLRLLAQQADSRRTRAVVTDENAGSKALPRFFIRNAFDLRQVSSLMLELRIREPMLQGAVAGQQQKAFAVLIETTSSINVLDGDILLARAPRAGELATNAERLIEENVAVEQTSDYSILWAQRSRGKGAGTGGAAVPQDALGLQRTATCERNKREAGCASFRYRSSVLHLQLLLLYALAMTNVCRV